MERTRPAGLAAVTNDGRTVLLRERTWEFTSGPRPTSYIATTATGQAVLLRSDGTWIYQGTSGSKPVVRSSYIHLYQLRGGSGKATIFLDGEPIAQLREQRYFVIRVSPGPHVFNIFNTKQGRLALNAAPGMHYYINKVTVFSFGGEKLRFTDAATGKAEIGRLKPLAGTDVLRPSLFLEPQMASRN